MLSHTFVTAQKLHRVVSSVCPWLHEIVLTSINISKRHWMRQGEADKTESNLNELIEWTNDVCSIQNTKNLCCPCLEEGKGGRHRDKKRERGNYKVRTRRRNGEEIWLDVNEVRFARMCLVDFGWRAILRFPSDTQWTLLVSHFISPSFLCCHLPFRNKMKGWSGAAFI